MNKATITQLQKELADTEVGLAKAEQLSIAYEAKLEEANKEWGVLSGNRTAIRRLLKQNDALPE